MLPHVTVHVTTRYRTRYRTCYHKANLVAKIKILFCDTLPHVTITI